jgi:hypothetical protein
MTSRFRFVVRDEKGAVIVIVAAGLAAFVFLVAFVVDVANWKIHSRHLQLQADAAALAAAHTLGAGACSDSVIAADAHNYGGPDASGAVANYNAQVGGTPASRMHLLINSAGYYGDAGAGDNTDPNGSPCTSKYVDIKLTETDLPWYFGGLVSKINAHARVSLLQETSANGTLPIAVPNPVPKSAAAIFINEANGSILGPPLSLTDLGRSGPLELFGSGTSGLPLVTVAARTGVVIALSGRTSMSLAGTLTQICQQNLTDCYDAGAGDPPTTGLSFIRGYAVGGEDGTQPHQPKLRSVELFPTGACVSPYFSDGTCTYDLVARIDAGTTVPKANQIYGANGVTLTSSTDPNCTLVAGADQCWHGNLTVPANSGPQDIDITWEETTGTVTIGGKDETCKTTGNKCKGDFGNAQRAFSTLDTRSGPIKALDVCTFDLDTSCTQTHDQSYPTGDQHRFAVTIGIGGTLQNAADTSDPIVVLRIKSQTGQSLDCDPGYTNLKTELQLGCRPTYNFNSGTPDCSTIGTSALWASTQPWSCIAVNTGRQPNDISAGLNARLYQGNQSPTTCAPVDSNGHNNWHMFVQNAVNDGFPSGDPRILNAYITTYGAFSHVNGTSGSVPVIAFGHFYVTGYTGQGGGFKNPCEAASPSNYTGMYPDDPVPNGDSGLIVGHFIRFVDTLGGDGTTPCDPSSINACVIVMTK